MATAPTFDYVVVGAGTAGCVVASRLAAAGARVALVEAGGPYRRLLDVPLLSLWAWLRWPSRYCWQDQTEPQAELDGRRVFWPAGRLVGGSSAINAMIYCRGHRASYDRWQRLASGGHADTPVWDYEALLPYFRRAEDFEGDESVHHGTGGPVGVSASRHRTALAEAFLRGCDEVGIARTEDFNAETAEGASYLHVTQRRGRRASSVRYLRPGPDLGRPTAWLGSPVRRIVFERGRATGVELGGPGGGVIRAAREVVLCAGAVRSPQLLMLSGVGPAEALRSLGIGVVADRPDVGANLQDHVRVPVAHECAGPRPTAPAALVRGAIRYALRRRGLFASNVADAAAIVRLDAAGEIPNVRVVCRWRVLPEHPAWVVDFEVVAIDPASRGRVTLRSADPMQPARIDPGYLTAPMDADALRRGVDLARAIATTAACRAAGIGAEVLRSAVMVQIETSACIDALAEICQQPEVDLCVVGPGDLAMSMGLVTRDSLLGYMKADELKWCFSYILQICTAAGKIAGGFTRGGDPSSLLRHGFSLVALSNDLMDAMTGAESIMTGAVRAGGVPVKTAPNLTRLGKWSRNPSKLIPTAGFIGKTLVPAVLSHLWSVKGWGARRTLVLPKVMPANVRGTMDMEKTPPSAKS